MQRLPQAAVATLAVAVLPGLIAGGLQGAGIIDWWWLSMALAVALSMGVATVGSAVWARRPASHEIVFEDLMLWAGCGACGPSGGWRPRAGCSGARSARASSRWRTPSTR